ncbi:PAS-domain containing protein, partial [Schnuerera sp.]|uniref:PAS-domain containing protein n=1 Tax=Schnuerera sp. TaxID=2794844 RepID=UPI0039C9D106
MGDADLDGWIRDRVVAHQNPTGEPLLRHYADDTWALVRENRTPDGGIIQTRTDVTALRQA